jgi:hypothetical protein
MRARRLVGAFVLLAWFSVPALGVLSAATGDPHASCDDHVCQCRPKAHCPSKRPAGMDCHEATGSRPFTMTSRCNHEPEVVPLAVRSDSIPSPTEVVSVALASAPVRDNRFARPRAGHTRLDPHPPKLAS